MKKTLLLSTILLVSWTNAQHKHDGHQHMSEADKNMTKTVDASSSVTSDTEAEAAAEKEVTPDNGGSAKADANDHCQVVISGNDRMKYDIKSFTVPKQCQEFTIHFKNIGKLPKTSMGHNVIIAKKSEARDIAQAGMSAGAANDYLQPDDSRIIVKTKMIGGGEKTDLTFATKVLKSDEDYVFFCSFPGHFFTMQGKVIIEQ